ncbi:MAG: hypothetical protein OJF48_003192 [Afipia sp.]|jgi:hypothetical protein|nr:MAG: hypothetical protein OJF48_003192 [Afipia sp.]
MGRLLPGQACFHGAAEKFRCPNDILQPVAIERRNPHILMMSSKPQTKPQTPEQLARLEKQRLARIEGEIALAEVDKQYVDVRKNMERLKALRLAKEAEEAANPPPVEPKKKRAPPKKLAVVRASEAEAVGCE